MIPQTFVDLFADNQDPNRLKSAYIQQMISSLKHFDSLDLRPLVEQIVQCHQNGKKIITFGNGGSAANASHFCTGISYVSKLWSRPLRSICLSDNSVLMSSLANDHGFENIFYRQLQVLLEPGDLIFAFSISGQSKNILNAVEYAQSKKSHCVGFTGQDGGALKKMADSSIHLPQSEFNQGIAEDCHMILGHILGYYLELRLK